MLREGEGEGEIKELNPKPGSQEPGFDSCICHSERPEAPQGSRGAKNLLSALARSFGRGP